MSVLKHRAVRGVKWTTGATGVVAGLKLVQLGVLAAVLHPRDFGLIALAELVVGLGEVLADAGIGSAVVRRRDLVRAQIATLWCVQWTIGTLAAAVILATVPFVAQALSTPELQAVASLAALALPVAALGHMHQALLARELRFEAIARADVLAAVAASAVSVATALAGFGACAFVLGALAAATLRSAALAVAGWQLFRPQVCFRLRSVHSVLGFGVWHLGERLLNWLSLRIDQLLLGTLLGLEALGAYSLAWRLTFPQASVLPAVLARVAYPFFAAVHEDRARLRHAYLRVIAAVATANAPLMLGLAVLAPCLLPLVSDHWAAAIPLTQCMALTALLRSLSAPVSGLLLAAGRPEITTRWSLGVLLVTPLVVGAGGMLGGAIGIALASLLLAMTATVLAYRWLIVPVLGRFGAAYTVTLAKPIALGLVMALAVWLASRAGTTALGLAAQVMLGAGVFAALLWLCDRPHARDLWRLARGEPSAGLATTLESR